MTGWYTRFVLPRLIDWAMRNDELSGYRRELVPTARGRVLEIGIGSGLNIPLYPLEVDLIVGIDPSPELLRRAASMATRSTRPVLLVQASAEAIPLASETIDTVVMTWTLCSIPDANAALREMRRVLKPSGQLLFVEHGLAADRNVASWQHRLDPLWWKISCHLDNPVDRLLRDAGFKVDDLQTGHLPHGPKPMTFIYRGIARP
jgi:SAM-dependent methyltransferase